MHSFYMHEQSLMYGNQQDQCSLIQIELGRGKLWKSEVAATRCKKKSIHIEDELFKHVFFFFCPT